MVQKAQKFQITLTMALFIYVSRFAMCDNECLLMQSWTEICAIYVFVF